MTENNKASAVEKILNFLKIRGPQTAITMAKRFSVTAMAIRQHLYCLEKEGIVRHQDRKAKVGRPTRYWHLTEKSNQHFPNEHGALSVELLASAEQAFGKHGIQKLIDARFEETLTKYHQQLEPIDELEQRIFALAKIRDDEGFMAQVRHATNGNYLLIENHCPILAAAKTCGGLCGSELKLFQNLLGEQVTVTLTEHILQANRRCVYRIEKNLP